MTQGDVPSLCQILGYDLEDLIANGPEEKLEAEKISGDVVARFVAVGSMISKGQWLGC